jgi:hypothetical protein
MEFEEWDMAMDERFFKRQTTHYCHKLLSNRLARGHRTAPVYLELVLSTVLMCLLEYPDEHTRAKLRLAMEQGAFGPLSTAIVQNMSMDDLGFSWNLLEQHITTLKQQCESERVPCEPMGNEPLQWPF